MKHEAVIAGIKVGTAGQHHAVEQVQHPVQVVEDGRDEAIPISPQENARAGCSPSGYQPRPCTTGLPRPSLGGGWGRDLVLFGGRALLSVKLGRHASPGCCSCSRARCCCGSPTGNSSPGCSSYRRDSRGSSLLRTRPLDAFNYMATERLVQLLFDFIVP